MKHIKIIESDEDKLALLSELETWKEGRKYATLDRQKAEAKENEFDRLIFEANIKLRSYEKRQMEDDTEPLEDKLLDEPLI